MTARSVNKLKSIRTPTTTSLQGAAGSLRKKLNWKKVKQIVSEDLLDTLEFDNTIRLKRISLKDHKKKKV